MKLTTWLTPAHLLEFGGWLTLGVWAMYKKELQDWLKGCFCRWHARLFPPPLALMVTDAQLQLILGNGHAGLETLLYLLLREYAADRATVMVYTWCADGSLQATCVVEAKRGEMPSIKRLWQQQPVPAALKREIEHIHEREERRYYVRNAHTLDNAALRDALLSSGVWSAFYQSLADPNGKQHAMLSLNWSRERLLTKQNEAALHLSGIACATVLQLVEALTPPKP